MIHATLDTSAGAERALRSRQRHPTETMILLGNNSLPELKKNRGQAVATPSLNFTPLRHSSIELRSQLMAKTHIISLFTKIQGRNFIKFEQRCRAVFLWLDAVIMYAFLPFETEENNANYELLGSLPPTIAAAICAT